ncbi:MAG: hypothetical protein ACFFDT_13575 [Candidatus Hodarchaeota archaeon]
MLSKGKKQIIALFILSFFIKVFVAMFSLLFFNWETIPPFPWDQLIIGTLEPYLDYKLSYTNFVQAFIHEDWFPYISEVSDPILASYVYPPLFLYALTLPGLINMDLVFLPLLLSDILSPLIIYFLLIHSHGEKIARWGFVAIAFCPFSIFYNSGLLFNMSIVIFFFTLSLYLIYIKRLKWATFTLAISFLIKQIILFLIIPIFIYIILKSTEDKQTSIVTHTIILLGTLFIGSLPWILIAPNKYVTTLLMGQQITLTPIFSSPALTWPLHWYSFLIELKVPYWALYITGFLNFTAFGLMMLQLTNIILLLYWDSKDSLEWPKFLCLITYNALLNHLFLPRGVYKYYFTLHVPLIVLWICFNFTPSFSSTSWRKKALILFLAISLLFLLIHRFFYLWLVWIIFFSMLIHNLGNRIFGNRKFVFKKTRDGTNEENDKFKVTN